MTITDLARICHEANRAYCQSIGDDSQAVWDQAPNWQQASAIHGVQIALDNPEISPAGMHESWLLEKQANGWVYGPEKNPELKQHPCMVPYDQLPEAQRVKDKLFRGLVFMLRDSVVR